MIVRAGLGAWRPQFEIAVTVPGAARAVVAAAAMALLGGLVPARRLARLSPSAAFGGAT